jgi:hypothetical protein
MPSAADRKYGRARWSVAIALPVPFADTDFIKILLVRDGPMAATSNPALALLAKSIADVVGANSELYRDVLRAVESDEYVDIMLAQASFDTLSGEIKREISERVDDLVATYLAKGQSVEEMADELAGKLPDGMA